MAQAKVTTDHEEIKKWVEERAGKPSKVKNATGEGMLLRIKFPQGGESEENLETISWEDFFAEFEHSKLAFLYEDGGEGESRFNKFINR